VSSKTENKTNLRIVPSVIGTRTAELAPLLEKWAAQNPGIAWSKLLDRALKKELAPLAGKRFSHLVEEKQ
jgi:hypothetical protein